MIVSSYSVTLIGHIHFRNTYRAKCNLGEVKLKAMLASGLMRKPKGFFKGLLLKSSHLLALPFTTCSWDMDHFCSHPSHPPWVSLFISFH